VFWFNLLVAATLTGACSAVMAVVLLAGVGLPERDLIRLRARLLRGWAVIVTRGMGFRVRVRGPRPEPGDRPIYLVANHQTYLDIVLLASIWPVTFVSRHDAARWPVLGPLIRMVGTVFVDRTSAMATARVVGAVVRALEAGAHLAAFPEGTTGGGDRVMPFKTALFEAPVRAGAWIQPVTVRYTALAGRPLDRTNRDRVCWHGHVPFLPHVLGLLKSRGLEAEVVFGRGFPAPDYRKTAARMARDEIEANFRPVGD